MNTMKNHDKIEAAIEKHCREKDWKKRKRMKVSGKSVFTLQIIGKNRVAKKLISLKKRKA